MVESFINALGRNEGENVVREERGNMKERSQQNTGELWSKREGKWDEEGKDREKMEALEKF